MRILHVNSYYNGSKFYKNLYDEQIKQGLDICVYVPVSKINESDFGEYTIVSKTFNSSDRLIFQLKHYKILKDIINKVNIKDYNLIHAHSLFSNGYIAYKLKQEYGIPYVVAVRNTDVNIFFSKMFHLRKLGLDILSNASSVVFISKPYKEKVLSKYVTNELKKKIEDKSKVIPNGIKDYWYENINQKQKDLTVNCLRLLYVGDIDKNKNIETTIKACELLIKKKFDIKYSIIGKIKNINYQRLIEQHEFIEYLGYLPKEELLLHYRQNDIFVMPSKHETFGLVYAEAMSQGLPVIYTRGQGFDGQYDEGEVGYSVKYDSIDELVNNILRIVENYGVISKKAVLESSKYNWDRIANVYTGLYSETATTL